MQSKLTRKQNIVTGIMNALGFGKKRGGAGAVAAALAVCAIIASLTISAVGEPANWHTPTNDDIPCTDNDTQPTPWDKPVILEQIPEYNGAVPGRLPC
jgi:hypothetical protein